MEAGPLSQPGPHLSLRGRASLYGVFVSAVVVDNQVEVQVLGDGLLDLAQKAQELLVPVAGLALGDHLPCGHVQRREQGCGAVADVVMGDALDVPRDS